MDLSLSWKELARVTELGSRGCRPTPRKPSKHFKIGKGDTLAQKNRSPLHHKAGMERASGNLEGCWKHMASVWLWRVLSCSIQLKIWPRPPTS
eukprot:1158275-Pelagomonas_calceolata.AAC.2